MTFNPCQIPSTVSPVAQGLRTRFLGDLSQYLQEIVVLPPRKQAAGGDTLAFAGLLCLEQAQRQLAEPRQVHRAVPGPVALVILAEADVQHPVQRVLDPPMTAHPAQVVLRRPGRTPDEVADLDARHTL